VGTDFHIYDISQKIIPWSQAFFFIISQDKEKLPQLQRNEHVFLNI
jgi:hypothetical protein